MSNIISETLPQYNGSQWNFACGTQQFCKQFSGTISSLFVWLRKIVWLITCRFIVLYICLCIWLFFLFSTIFSFVLPWNLVQISMMTVVSPWLFLLHHHEVGVCRFDWNVSTTTGWVVMKLPLSWTALMNPFFSVTDSSGTMSPSLRELSLLLRIRSLSKAIV